MKSLMLPFLGHSVDACRELNIYLFRLFAESAVPVRKLKSLEKNSVSENRLCSEFVTNAIKELLRYDKCSCTTRLQRCHVELKFSV